MSNLTSALLDNEILLESGTNELELLVFDVANFTFGINVAKVREVLPTPEITSLPRAHQSVRGVFKLRDRVIPAVSLLDHLGIEPTSEETEKTLILTDFNQQQVAFLVDSVDRIHRLSWENILSVPGLESLAHMPVTALARCQERLIVMLDFEMILNDVTEEVFSSDSVENPQGLPRDEFRILLADDSPTVREAIGATLRSSGYTQLTFFENGEKIWNWIVQQFQETENAASVADLIISDVEMPQVDGFHLTKRIKDHPELKQIPVLLYSSIVTPDNHKKGLAVGADAQLAKPEIYKVVQMADDLITKAQQKNRETGWQEVAKVVQSQTSQQKPDSNASSVPTTSPSAAAKKEAASCPRAPKAATPPPASPPPATSGPSNVNPSLWATFQRELADHEERLQDLFERVQNKENRDEAISDILRTLHTVKSAAMVVPVEPISRCTHLLESLIANVRDTQGDWPTDKAGRYADWLSALVNPSVDVNQTLAHASELTIELSESLTNQ